MSKTPNDASDNEIRVSNKLSKRYPILTPKAIHNPHNKLFKRALADIEVAKDFFDIHLPPEWKSHCKLETLTLSHECGW